MLGCLECGPGQGRAARQRQADTALAFQAYIMPGPGRAARQTLVDISFPPQAYIIPTPGQGRTVRQSQQTLGLDIPV